MYASTLIHNIMSGCVDSFLLEIFPACRKGTVSYELFYKFERCDASILQVPDVLCSFPGIKPLVQCLEVPRYSNGKFTLLEDGFKCSPVLQAFIQLASRLNSVFINFWVYLWKLPVYRIPGGVEYVFSLLKLELRWITHSMCKACTQLLCKYCVLLLFLEVTLHNLKESQETELYSIHVNFVVKQVVVF